MAPLVSVVVVTHNRAPRLAALLDSLERQTLGKDQFEVVVVDDGSTDGTGELLARERARRRFPIRVLARQAPSSRAAARNAGWRAAAAPVVAFVDDDCIAAADWLEQGLAAARRNPHAIVQGRVDPIASELPGRSPATRTQRVHGAGPYFQTCNIFYPRRMIERVGGFDAHAFTLHGGEDTDLAWRAISAGAGRAYAETARVYHAVNRLGLIGRLRFAAHWHESMLVYKRHPALREQVFTKRVFWKHSHYALARFLVALLLLRRRPALFAYLARPYLLSVRARIREENGTSAHAAFYLLEDLVEMVTMARASVRHRMLVL